MTPDGNRTSVAVIGAGPAGLTAAYELVRRQVPVTVLEGDAMVGGISRTAEREGWRFDIGGHRFFTKVPEVEALWHEILPDEEFLLRPRMSRIFYDGKLFDYPLKAANALGNLGPVEAVRCVASYLWARVRPPRNQDTLEGWIVARFGKRLYEHFFKTYNEKLWGVPVDQLPADFAAQRIKNLSLTGAVLNALTPRRNQKDITSLIEEFQYPKYGPGMMWEAAARQVRERGGTVVLEEKVRTVHWEPGRGVTGLTTVVTGGYGSGAGAPEATRTDVGTEEHYVADHVISSMPFSSLVHALDPKPPVEVLQAADGLKYRDFLTVALVLPVEAGFPDNWIYIHSPDVQVGRIQNFGSWSPYLVKDGRTCLGMEFFVNVGDDTWNRSDEELIAQGARELEHLGLARASDVERGFVVRMPKAYPFYDAGYKDNVEVIRRWIETHTPNLHPVGRNGMFRYNNQDHSMMTAMLTVQNIADGAQHDIWDVNVEEDYHEEVSSQRPDATADDHGSPHPSAA
ncbi:NAD(P)/FAD-dependent oxidoreductase [Geodermatophilus sp. DSM 44513]|uniref:NAD(P)/FAD-dependent oxidoreductase n=1 Tax=Geodermatophilus sp. DSM 44513 TaxID=1528104 RepID=UPI00126CCACC|nr:NAD(P)/FAD-dependent oxidoreductase [Geodermatophilus sp. DSM 44513]WNV77254.1 NAD(P)/FAD-dependent oxidoreductase [Geodermatophilus sp. DSM 44513]